MDVGRYRHDYEDLNEKVTTSKFINRERITSSEGAQASLLGNSPFSSLFSFSEEFEHEIQSFSIHVDNARGWTLKKLQGTPPTIF